MKMALSVLLLFALVLHCHAGKKPAISEENLAKLQAVKTVFVDGNSESADKLREKLESWTCLKLTNNKSQAGAVMSVEEREKPSDLHKLATSVVITMRMAIRCGHEPRRAKASCILGRHGRRESLTRSGERCLSRLVTKESLKADMAIKEKRTSKKRLPARSLMS